MDAAAAAASVNASRMRSCQQEMQIISHLMRRLLFQVKKNWKRCDLHQEISIYVRSSIKRIDRYACECVATSKINIIRNYFFKKNLSHG